MQTDVILVIFTIRIALIELAPRIDMSPADAR
jgi:hypothetical protein